MRKLQVGVIRGGPSEEYEISLESGASAMRHLNENHTCIDVFIDKNGVWHIGGVPISISQVGQQVDVVLNCLHGKYGEDGSVQKLLEDFKIPYTGSSAVASAIGMNKAQSKEIYQKTGLKTPEWSVIDSSNDIESQIHEAFGNIPIPYFVKPTSSGSSLGVFHAHDYFSLQRAVERSSKCSEKVLIEEAISGREATCGVIDNFRGERYYALLPIEITPAPGRNFFDYTSKYSGESKELCPGGFSTEEKIEIQNTAIKAHQLIGARHCSRTDMIITPKGGVYILETNTLPGLTDNSLLPKSLIAVGSDVTEFLEHIISLALE